MWAGHLLERSREPLALLAYAGVLDEGLGFSGRAPGSRRGRQRRAALAAYEDNG